jgi:triacylglycerol lipase
MRLSLLRPLSISLFSLALGCEGSLSGSGAEVGSGQNLTCNPAPYPIILHHGFSGGDGSSAEGYFVDVADDLRQNLGEVVFEAATDPFNSSDVRGGQLAAIVDDVLAETGACKVNIIAHSQGGLDSRYMISSLGYSNKVAALVTVATPHRGTALADLALGFTNGLTEGIANSIAGWVKGRSLQDPDLRAAFGSLAVRNSAAFNSQNPNSPQVSYYSVAGRSLLATANFTCAGSRWGNSSAVDATDPLFAASGTFLFGSIFPWFWKANDGVVTVESAKFGIFLGCVPADHTDLQGSYAGLFDQSVGFDHIDLYRDLADVLHADGF